MRAPRGAGASFDIVLLDPALLREASGAALKGALKHSGAPTLILLLAAEPDFAAVEMLRGDAFDFIAKPPNPAELQLRVGRALRAQRPPAKPRAGSPGDRRRPRKSDVIIGGAAWIKELYERLAMVAPTDVAVAIYGESGTGKELVARTLHTYSHRSDKPFVVVNCAAIPENLLEDELFGHVQGAFTNATKDRDGLFQTANGGTLFLDEIGEMPLALQVKLLRVLQSQEFRRIGDDRDTQVDVRIITATNRNLEKAIASGAFREDLYFRINVFPMSLPPLRERREDIPLLAHHFLLKHRARVGKRVEGFTSDAPREIGGLRLPRQRPRAREQSASRARPHAGRVYLLR